VSHLAARARLLFAVEMQFDVAVLQQLLPLWLRVTPRFAQQIHHHYRSQQAGLRRWQAAHHSYLLLKL